MENSRFFAAPVTLKGPNYLLWARTMKTALGGRGLESHITMTKAPKTKTDEDASDKGSEGDNKWLQENQLVLGVIQGSLDIPLLEAYSYCENPKELWDTLKTVYGNTSNLNRVYEVKKAINDLSQEDMEFTKHFGNFRALWAEFEMLRPSTLDASVLNERREQDKVFGLLLTLNSSYEDVIKHILRGSTLPTLDEVCAEIQREQGSNKLFGDNKELVTVNKSVYKIEDKKNMTYKFEERKSLVCEHCKKKGHTKDKCWILHPHLKPSKFKDLKAHYTQEETDSQIGPSSTNQQQGDNSKALVPYTDDYVRKSDLESLIKALKEASKSGY